MVKRGVLQYSIIRVVITILSFVLRAFDALEEGHITPRSPWLYIFLIQNGSGTSNFIVGSAVDSQNIDSLTGHVLAGHVLQDNL